MTDVLLFHHAMGQTPGFLRFAEDLRRAGHTVHTPDLYDGRVFDDVESGVEHARSIGFGTVLERGVAAGEALPASLVYAGFSLGVMPAQKLAQTRPGASGALLMEACLPVAEVGGTWPVGVPVQIHGMGDDPSFAGEGDLDAARELVEATGEAELFVYPGDAHLFADDSRPSYHAEAAALLQERVLAFLDRIDTPV
jgi:dienelactone hydrolase